MKTNSAKISILALALPLALAACGDSSEPAGEATPAPEVTEAAQSATAELKDTDGNVIGMAMITGEDGALNVEVTAEGISAGTHGAHIHTTGDCSAADFTSAGGHWNPGETNHGTMGEAPNPHAGDIGNLEIAEDGTGTLTGTSAGSWAELLDDDGAAFVIHANADDMESQPAGDAGARVACGVFVTG